MIIEHDGSYSEATHFISLNVQLKTNLLCISSINYLEKKTISSLVMVELFGIIKVFVKVLVQPGVLVSSHAIRVRMWMRLMRSLSAVVLVVLVARRRADWPTMH